MAKSLVCTPGFTWTDALREAFKHAQTSLQTNKSITLPRPNDELWLVTDGSVKQCGVGATLYVMRNGKVKLAGFFSAKLRGRQISWLPCEIEALSIAAAIRHFSPYIVQSVHNTSILTDSKPCVQAHEKLCRGEFSVSPRISTFLSVVSRQSIPGNYSPSRRSSQCSIRLRESQCTHVPGTTVPSLLLCTTTGTISRDATRYNSRHNIWKSSTSVHQSVSMARYSSRLPRFAKDALASHTRNTAIKKGD